MGHTSDPRCAGFSDLHRMFCRPGHESPSGGLCEGLAPILWYRGVDEPVTLSVFKGRNRPLLTMGRFAFSRDNRLRCFGLLIPSPRAFSPGSPYGRPEE